jgi:hypothetical protein
MNANCVGQMILHEIAGKYCNYRQLGIWGFPDVGAIFNVPPKNMPLTESQIDERAFGDSSEETLPCLNEPEDSTHHLSQSSGSQTDPGVRYVLFHQRRASQSPRNCTSLTQ